MEKTKIQRIIYGELIVNRKIITVDGTDVINDYDLTRDELKEVKKYLFERKFIKK